MVGHAAVAVGAVTLINDTPVVPYSGMIPGCIAGQYNPDELSVDLQRLCAVGGVRLVLAAATHVDTAARQVHLQDRMPLDYTLLSLNIGSQPLIPPNDMPLAEGVPGCGWKCATLDATRWLFLALTPLALPGFLLKRIPAVYNALWGIGQNAVGVREHALAPAIMTACAV